MLNNQSLPILPHPQSVWGGGEGGWHKSGGLSSHPQKSNPSLPLRDGGGSGPHPIHPLYPRSSQNLQVLSSKCKDISRNSIQGPELRTLNPREASSPTCLIGWLFVLSCEVLWMEPRALSMLSKDFNTAHEGRFFGGGST